LVVGIEAPAERLELGRTYRFRITVRNTGSKPVTIIAYGGSPAYLLVYKHEVAGWEQILRYPRTDLMVVREWTLPPGRFRRFPMNVRVGYDWPTNEPLRVAGRINGLDDLEAAVELIVRRPEGEDG